MLDIVDVSKQLLQRRAMAFLFIATLVMVLAPLSSQFLSHASAADQIAVNAITPVNNDYVQGAVTFRTSVTGLQPDQYEMFWAVDNGTWNRMSQSNDTASAVVNVSSWNWQKNGMYKIAFIALQKITWQPIEKDIQIHVGSPATILTPAPASVASIALPSAIQKTIIKQLYTDPTTDVAQQATAWATSHPQDAEGMKYIAKQPLAAWFGNWNNNVQNDANSYVTKATIANQIPVLVAYDIPQRDCGSYSAGGSNNAQDYQSWIQQLAAGIGKRQALVIVEPDAVADMDCLSPADQTTRLNLLSEAITTLKRDTNATVYLDAGHPGWHSTTYMTEKLKLAGIANADGFSVNVSNFSYNSDNINYGTTLSKNLNNTHFVIDTSRNGNGPTSDNQWCNPSGRALGEAPTLSTGVPLVDAYLWVKAPGGSDGTCGQHEGGESAPPAGAWWVQYALAIVRSSSF